MSDRISLPTMSLLKDSYVLPICIISLTEEVGRRERLRERGIPNQWISQYFTAFDLREATNATSQEYVDNQTIIKRYGRTLRPAEIGCAMSHFNAYKWLASSDYQLMLILEDDIIPRTPHHITELQSICSVIAPLAQHQIPFICHLGVQDSYFQSGASRKVTFLAEHVISHDLLLHSDKGRAVWLAHAYLISRAAAVRILKQGAITCVADDFSAFHKSGAIEKIFIAKPGVYEQDQNIKSTVQVNTTVSVNHARGLKNYIEKIYYRITSLVTKFIPFRIDPP